ncbi:MAG: bifunctional diguanylate cyclase/phosphodiesterase [Bacillota bacterium]|nr:bifunctional diguanylate cyclase/phosphodiesterase [Bacillota bacterium]
MRLGTDNSSNEIIKKIKLLEKMQYGGLFIMLFFTILLMIVKNAVFMNIYVYYLLSGILVFILAIQLNKRKFYLISASITFVSMFAIVWGPILFNPMILEDGLSPLFNSLLIVVVSAVFLDTRNTLFLILIQFSLCIFVLYTNPNLQEFNWISLLSFYCVFGITVLTGSSNIKKNFEIIEQQKSILYEKIYFDSLTGIGSRLKFEENIDMLIKNDEAFFTIINFDIDNFNIVNKINGYSSGDRLLKDFSRIMEDVFLNEFLYRWSGDEFLVVLLTDEREHISRLMAETNDKFIEMTNGKYKLNECTLSAGVACYPKDGESISDLLQCTSLALDQSKNNGKNQFHYFQPLMRKETLKFHKIQKFINESFKNNNFELFLQPIYDIKTKTMCDAEILLRTKSKEFTLAEVLGVAEITSQIMRIDEWVVENTFKLISENKEFFAENRISINMSVHSFKAENLIEDLQKLLDKYDLDASKFTFEVTEHTAIVDIEDSKRIFTLLKQLGFKIAIDDFGTRYSSINYLNTLPIDVLKIDKSYVDNVAIDKNTAAIVKHIIALTKDLNLKTIAEGIENEEQFDTLDELGCDYAQGYLMNRPMNFKKFKKLIGIT